ncbi:MAG: hypothetical protein AAF456_25760 [Planctomycetota bacterium]
MSRFLVVAVFVVCFATTSVSEGQLLRRVLGGRPVAPQPQAFNGPQIFGPNSSPYGYAPQGQFVQPGNNGLQLRILNGHWRLVQPGGLLQQRLGNGQLSAQIDNRIQELQRQFQQRGSLPQQNPGVAPDTDSRQANQSNPERYNNPYASRQYSAQQSETQTETAANTRVAGEASAIPTTDLEEIAPPIVPASGTDIFVDDEEMNIPESSTLLPEAPYSILENTGGDG